MINKRFIHFKTYDTFIGNSGINGVTTPTNGYYNNVPEDAIVFILDTLLIWTHGTFYNGDIAEARVMLLLNSNRFKAFIIEDIIINDVLYGGGTIVDIIIEGELNILPTSNNSIAGLYSYPGALTWQDWLEGVLIFDNIIFDMNELTTYEKWNQGHQGQYHVQFAQYTNCIFWSDNAYISDVNKRPNYTLYYSSLLPLCFSFIPENTFKSFYFAYSVTNDPNWSNPKYRDSFAAATWATQAFSYYGLHSIGIFDMDSSAFNIVLPKDCRGLMFYAPNVLNAGVFDAINTTNFGAKSGSWRDAFAYCYCLENLYIKNLKVNINVSWSPISLAALNFILDNAANTNTITIFLSPYTYYRLTDANIALASEKNIILSLIDTNLEDDNRVKVLLLSGDGTKFLNNAGEYKSITCFDLLYLEYSLLHINSGTIPKTYEEFVSRLINVIDS